MTGIDDLSLAELEDLVARRSAARPLGDVGPRPVGDVGDVSAAQKLIDAGAQAYATIQNPTADGAKALAATAADAALSSPEIRQVLSTESKAFLGSLASSASAVLATVDVGKLAQAAGQSPAAFAGQLGMQAIATALTLGPTIAASLAGTALTAGSAAFGGLVAAAYAAMTAIAAPLNAELAEQAAARAERFAEGGQLDLDTINARLRPPATGPRGENRPADLFVYQDFSSVGKTWGAAEHCPNKGRLYRSFLGESLMRLTEAGLHTLPKRPNSDVGWEPEGDLERPTDHKCAADTPIISEKYYDLYINAIRARHKNPALGIPRPTRDVLEMLRRAMQAQHGVPGTDGGASLWPAYMDVLTREFDVGHLTADSLVDFFRAKVDWDYDAPSKKSIVFRSGANGELSAQLVNLLVDSWRKTINPIYAQDVAAREESNKLFVGLAKVAALKALGQKYLPAAVLKDVPPALQKQLGVSVRPTFGGLGPLVEAARAAKAREVAAGAAPAEPSRSWTPWIAGGGALAAGLALYRYFRGPS
jgi:hypothetical protein